MTTKNTKKSVKSKISNKTTPVAKSKSSYADGANVSKETLSARDNIRQYISELDKSAKGIKGYLPIIDCVWLAVAICVLPDYLEKHSYNTGLMYAFLFMIILEFIAIYRLQSNRIMVTLMKIEQHLADTKKKTK